MHQGTKHERMLGRRSRWLGLGVMLVGLLGCGTGGENTSTGTPGETGGGGQGGVGGMGGNAGGGAGGTGGSAGGKVVVPQGTSVFIEVKDPSGAPVPNAKVIRMDPMQPLEPRNADALGRILFENLPVGRFVAQVRAEGYTEASAVVDLKDGMHAGKRIVLHPFTQALPIMDLGMESTVEQGGVHVKIPADAMVDANGNPVTGPASVTIIPLDPTTDDVQNMPGPLEGTIGPNDGIVRLESVFMAEVTVWKDGHQLQLAPGKHATLTFDIPPSLQDYYKLKAGTTIPSWSFDVAGGVWRKEGEGVVQWSTATPNKVVWSAETYHFSWHNCDNPLYNEQYCYSVTVVDINGNPIPDVYVYSEGIDGGDSNDYGYTDSNGATCMSVKLNSMATMSVHQAWDWTALSMPIMVSAGSDFRTCEGGAGQNPCQPLQIVAQPPVDPFCWPGSWSDCEDEYPFPGKMHNSPCQAGRKWCKWDGSGFEPCFDVILPQLTDTCSTWVDEDCDGDVNNGCPIICAYSDEGPGQPPNAKIPCYSGPTGTELVGICHGGFQYCMQGGAAWGPCTGEQTPYNNERCYDWYPTGDYDCDGRFNRLIDPNVSDPNNPNYDPNHPNHSNNAECTCWAWDVKFDYPQDANVSAVSNPYVGNDPYPNSQCIVGLSYCNPNWEPSPAVPTFWIDASGWTSPAAEVCGAANTTDEDCDGVVNEDGWYCCTPGDPITGCTLDNACQNFTCSSDHECTYDPVSTPTQTDGDCQTIMCALDLLKFPQIAYAEVPLPALNDNDDLNDCTNDECVCANGTCTEYEPKHENLYDPMQPPLPCSDSTRPAATVCNEMAECVECLNDSNMKWGCAAGLHCHNGQCFSCTDTMQYCTNFQCYPCSGATCLLDGNETDVNCGGPFCAQCADGKGCLDGSDCTSQVCNNGVCQAPTCSDCCKNGNETGTNCGGGTCSKCGNGGTCNGPSDCLSSSCMGGICVAPGCVYNMMLDPGETDVDCGGLGCAACGPNKHCLVNTDCMSTVCLNNGTPMNASDDRCQ